MSRWGEEEPNSRPAAGAGQTAPPQIGTRGQPSRAARAGRLILDGPVITRLVTYVGIALLIGVLVIVGARFLGAGFHTVPTLVVAGILGVVWWAVMMVADWPAYEKWEPATAVDPSLRVASDPRTRRLESMLSGSDSKHRMSARDVARTLAGIVEDTLVRQYGADPDSPLSAATGRLSPALLTFLRADPNGPVPVVTRRVLRTWLTEIDTLTRQRG